MDSERFAPQLVYKSGAIATPTNIEWLLAFAIKGCKWAEEVLPEAIVIANQKASEIELERCETYNGGSI